MINRIPISDGVPTHCPIAVRKFCIPQEEARHGAQSVTGGRLSTMQAYKRQLDQSREDSLWLAQARLADRRHDAERALVGAILADPASLVPVARDSGIEPGDFWSPDVRLIFCTLVVAHDLGVPRIIDLAKKALKAAKHWDDSSPGFYKGELHSDATLAALADSYPRNPALVRLKAWALLDLSRRQCRAQDHLAEAAVLLDVADVPTPLTPKQKRRRIRARRYSA